ncbi:MAG: hypothetical protein JWO59_1812 [Chloroflexi bacterium]|nr:hypothetical protein [Chloroflexota bacterium]
MRHPLKRRTAQVHRDAPAGPNLTSRNVPGGCDSRAGQARAAGSDRPARGDSERGCLPAVRCILLYQRRGDRRRWRSFRALLRVPDTGRDSALHEKLRHSFPMVRVQGQTRISGLKRQPPATLHGGFDAPDAAGQPPAHLAARPAHHPARHPAAVASPAFHAHLSAEPTCHGTGSPSTHLTQDGRPHSRDGCRKSHLGSGAHLGRFAYLRQQLSHF